VGPRGGLDGRKISFHWDSIPDRPARSSVALPTELPGPRYVFIGRKIFYAKVIESNKANT